METILYVIFQASSETQTNVLFLFMLLCLVFQSCPILCNPLDCRPAGSSVQGILQARILEQIVISSSKGSSWPRDQTWVSCVSYIAGGFFTLWAIGKALYSYNLSLLISCLKMANFTSGYATHKSAHIFISELSVTLGTSIFWIKKKYRFYFQ